MHLSKLIPRYIRNFMMVLQVIPAETGLAPHLMRGIRGL